MTTSTTKGRTRAPAGSDLLPFGTELTHVEPGTPEYEAMTALVRAKSSASAWARGDGLVKLLGPAPRGKFANTGTDKQITDYARDVESSFGTAYNCWQVSSVFEPSLRSEGVSHRVHRLFMPTEEQPDRPDLLPQCVAELREAAAGDPDKAVTLTAATKWLTGKDTPSRPQLRTAKQKAADVAETISDPAVAQVIRDNPDLLVSLGDTLVDAYLGTEAGQRLQETITAPLLAELERRAEAVAAAQVALEAAQQRQQEEVDAELASKLVAAQAELDRANKRVAEIERSLALGRSRNRMDSEELTNLRRKRTEQSGMISKLRQTVEELQRQLSQATDVDHEARERAGAQFVGVRDALLKAHSLVGNAELALAPGVLVNEDSRAGLLQMTDRLAMRVAAVQMKLGKEFTADDAR